MKTLVGVHQPDPLEEETENVSKCAKWAGQMEHNEFRCEFETLKTQWDHPMCNLIDSITSEDTLWKEEVDISAEGTYQTLYVNPLLLGLFRKLDMVSHL